MFNITETEILQALNPITGIFLLSTLYGTVNGIMQYLEEVNPGAAKKINENAQDCTREVFAEAVKQAVKIIDKAMEEKGDE